MWHQFQSCSSTNTQDATVWTALQCPRSFPCFHLCWKQIINLSFLSCCCHDFYSYIIIIIHENFYSWTYSGLDFKVIYTYICIWVMKSFHSLVLIFIFVAKCIITTILVNSCVMSFTTGSLSCVCTMYLFDLNWYEDVWANPSIKLIDEILKVVTLVDWLEQTWLELSVNFYQFAPA